MCIQIRPAGPGEGERVLRFYDALICAMEGSEYSPRWQSGIYPEDDMLLSAVERGEMYLALREERLVGAMVLNRSFHEGYADVPWPSGAKPEQAMCIHLLCVWPECFRQGIGRRLVEAAAETARRQGARVLRLDVLEGNLPAERLYRSCGFAFAAHRELFYEDTGRMGFDLYEFPVSGERDGKQ